METKDNQYEKRPDLREASPKKLALKIKKPKTKEKEKLRGKELGQIQELHLFEPPIDPALLVKARAMELNKKAKKKKQPKKKL